MTPAGRAIGSALRASGAKAALTTAVGEVQGMVADAVGLPISPGDVLAVGKGLLARLRSRTYAKGGLSIEQANELDYPTGATAFVAPIKGLRGLVNYEASDLGQIAKATRLQTSEFTAKNLVVFEYKAADCSLKTVKTFSERGVGHAERIIAKDLEAMGVDPSRVTRIFSELEPCNAPGGFCKAFIGRTFAQAEVSWAFEYGDAASRARGIAALREFLKKLKP